MATFLSLVNDAIRESGQDISTLSAVITSGNTMQARWCNWVIQSWEDIQQEYNLWSFMKSSAVVTLPPRLHYYDGTTVYATSSTMEGIELSGADWTRDPLTILYFSPASVSSISIPAEGYIDLKVVPDQPIDFIIPTGLRMTTTNNASARGFTGFFKHWGWYDMNDLHLPYTQQGYSTDTSDIGEIDWTSFRIYNDAYIREEAAGSYIDYNNSTESKLHFMPWEEFTSRGYDVRQAPGIPAIVTQTPTGEVTFHPPPSRSIVCRFTYTKVPQLLSDSSDEPTGLPSRYHKLIMWRAVMKYATYDEQPALLRRASDEYENLMRRVRRDFLPKVKVISDYTW